MPAPTETVLPVGTCYEDAWRFLIREEEGDLIHGSLQLTKEGARVKHAWVELPTGFIWEPQTNSYYTTDDFKIMSPIEEDRYTAEEAAIMLARVGKHGPWTKEEKDQFLKGGNPSRVRFDRADIDSAIAAAKRLESEKDLYVFATHLGYTIDRRPPPGIQSYFIIHPDGSTEAIKPIVGGNPMPKTGSELKSIQERIFGKGSPLERLGKEEKLNKLLPMSPEEGPPLPRMFALKWPWKE